MVNDTVWFVEVVSKVKLWFLFLVVDIYICIEVVKLVSMDICFYYEICFGEICDRIFWLV